MTRKRIVLCVICIVVLCIAAVCVWSLCQSFAPVPINDTPPDIFTPPILLL